MCQAMVCRLGSGLTYSPSMWPVRGFPCGTGKVRVITIKRVLLSEEQHWRLHSNVVHLDVIEKIYICSDDAQNVCV